MVIIFGGSMGSAKKLKQKLILPVTLKVKELDYNGMLIFTQDFPISTRINIFKIYLNYKHNE